MLDTVRGLTGVIVPLLTPFDAAGEVDERALRILVDRLIDRGVHGFLPCGTTGEGPLLTGEERQRIARTVVEQTRGRVPVIIQVGAVSTRETIALARHAWQIRADAIAVVAPFYYPCSDVMLREHYMHVCAVVPDLPVYLYNIPQRTGNALSPPLVDEIVARCANVIGIKDSGGNLGQTVEMLAIRDGTFHVVMGSDGLVLPALTMGVRASVSGNANVFPALFVALFEAYRSGNLSAARGAGTDQHRAPHPERWQRSLALQGARHTTRGVRRRRPGAAARRAHIHHRSVPPCIGCRRDSRRDDCPVATREGGRWLAVTSVITLVPCEQSSRRARVSGARRRRS